MRIHNLILIFAISCFLSGCARPHLTVQTDFLNRAYLASYTIDTPDPRLQEPFYGQRLLIEWSLPSRFFIYDDLHLEVTIRFLDRTEMHRRIDIETGDGYYLYVLCDKDYLQKQGILTYKIDLVGSGNIVEAWRHHLWAELIHIGER